MTMTVPPVASPSRTWALDEPLLRFGEGDVWTIRDTCEGTQIFGATGSGKTSGSGRALAEAFLRAGFGGLVLTVKPDETDLWIEYARRTGREASLLVFSPSKRRERFWHPRTGEMLRYNFLEHEACRPGEGAGLTENIVLMFSTVLELTERGQETAGPTTSTGGGPSASSSEMRLTVCSLRDEGSPFPTSAA
jgi:hypothetical protein